MRTALAFTVLTLALPAWGGDSKYMTYDEFIRHVELGVVLSVEVDGYSSIRGVMADGEEERPFHSYTRTGGANDPLLMRLLNEHGVPVSLGTRDDRDSMGMMMFSGLMFMGAPLIMLILLIVILVKLNHILATQPSLLQLWGASARNVGPDVESNS